MHPYRSLALRCFQWAELSSVPERLLLRVCLGSWRREGAKVSSSGFCERGVREEVDLPPREAEGCALLCPQLGKAGGWDLPPRGCCG